MKRHIVLFACAALPLVSCGGDESKSQVPDRLSEYRVFAPGELINRFPKDPYAITTEHMIGVAWGLSGNPAGDGAVLADHTGHQVFYLDGSAELRAVIGTGVRGEGVGELDTPRNASVDSDGNVWVSDANRFTRFSPSGEYIDTRRHAITRGGFGVLPEGVPYAVDLTPHSLLWLAGDISLRRPSIDPGLIPSTMDRPRERAMYSFIYGTLPPDTILTLPSGEKWRDAMTVVLSPDRTRVVSVEPFRLPSWLERKFNDAIEGKSATRNRRSDVISELVMLTAVQVVDRTVWLTTSGVREVIAVAAPRVEGDSAAVVVAPGSLAPGEPEAGCAVSSAVLGDRLLTMCDYQVRAYKLERVDPTPFIEWAR